MRDEAYDQAVKDLIQKHYQEFRTIRQRYDREIARTGGISQ